MQRKLKKLVIGLTFAIGYLILSFSGTYNINAEKKPVICESRANNNRVKTQVKYNNYMTLVITPTPIVKEINRKIITTKKKHKTKYTKEDLRLLAGIIENEAGSKYCTNQHQKFVSSVIMNRVHSKLYPNTIKKVIFQNGKWGKQYSIGRMFYHPSKRAYKNAKYILEHGSILPKSILFQSEFEQGDFIYYKIKTIRSTTYFCGIREVIN